MVGHASILPSALVLGRIPIRTLQRRIKLHTYVWVVMMTITIDAFWRCPGLRLTRISENLTLQRRHTNPEYFTIGIRNYRWL